MAYGDPWTCLGDGAAHAAAVEEVEPVWGGRFYGCGVARPADRLRGLKRWGIGWIAALRSQ